MLDGLEGEVSFDMCKASFSLGGFCFITLFMGGKNSTSTCSESNEVRWGEATSID
ncbi:MULTISPECIES: hypothetical protein [Bacillus]|uniref:hypothetical protein n=1 Tax=Bacillus sp. IT-79MI2 TaxID=3026438 RepID=UPI0012ADEBD1